MEKYEIQKLRELPIEKVAKEMGMKVEHHKALCPFHDDHHASLMFSKTKNSCRCYVCMRSSIGTIDLAMRYLGKDFPAACRWLAEEHQIQLEEDSSSEKSSSLGGSSGRGASSGSSSGGFSSGSSSGDSSSGDNSGKSSFDASRYARFFEHPWLNQAARRFLFEERKIDWKAKETLIQVGEMKGQYRFILGTELYNKLSESKVIKEAAIRSGVSVGVMQVCWDAAGEVIKAWCTEGHSVAVPGLGTMRFGVRAKSVPTVGEVATSLITNRRVIFTPSVDIKRELQETSIQITCYDRNGKVVKNVTSDDKGDVEDPDNTPGGGGGSDNTQGGGNTEGGGTTGGNEGDGLE